MKAVVLAAGRGTRMQTDAAALELTDRQRAVARLGLKPLIPFDGVPFIHFVLAALADAGCDDVCLVVRSGNDPIRAHFRQVSVQRVRLHFAVQQAPLGTAHALLAATDFAGSGDVIVINADNWYPPDALRALAEMDGHATIGFDRAGLLGGNITPAHLTGYALLETTDERDLQRAASDARDPQRAACNERDARHAADPRHAAHQPRFLERITEKPSPALLDRQREPLFSMTCWRFAPSIFSACRAVRPSARGEHELPEAVALLMHRLGERVAVLPLSAPVLDLSSPRDVCTAGRALAGLSSDI
jgi:dTDP-glucose pyrophosphorylase